MNLKKHYGGQKKLDTQHAITDHMHVKLQTAAAQVLSSVLTLGDPMDCATPGSFVLHYILKFAQILIY